MQTVNVSLAAKGFFTTLGVNLDPPKSVFFNDRLGVLFVRATSQDLDTIEKAIQVLNMTPPQVHIKARFIEVEQDDSTALGFDWYLGQFNMGQDVVGQGGTSPSLNVPVSAANPLGRVSRQYGCQPRLRVQPRIRRSAIWSAANSGIPTIGHHHGHFDRSQFPGRDSRLGTAQRH